MSAGNRAWRARSGSGVVQALLPSTKARAHSGTRRERETERDKWRKRRKSVNSFNLMAADWLLNAYGI